MIQFHHYSFFILSNEQGSHTAGLISPVLKHFKNAPQTHKISNQKTAPVVM